MKYHPGQLALKLAAAALGEEKLEDFEKSARRRKRNSLLILEAVQHELQRPFLLENTASSSTR